ncbi:MAG: hypothetical protein IJ859_08920 [Synergistaceae bacterium]|nr:hypothetical protein [Synergistaceae bacterium]
MLKLIHDIYSRNKTFIDFEAHDLEDGAVWFNNSEFARYHDINGKKILALFTNDVKNKSINIRVGNDENPEGIAKGLGVLFVRVKDIKGVIKADSSLKLDGELYTVSEASLQGQVWRIVLEANR